MTALAQYNGVWSQYGNGQTLLGPYRPANLVNAGVGSVAIAFSTPTEGIMTMSNGQGIPITRFIFASRD